MISKGNGIKFARFVLPADLYIFTRLEIIYQVYLLSWHFLGGYYQAEGFGW